MSGINQTIRGAVQEALGSLNLPGAFTAPSGPNPGGTTTAVNAAVVVNGQLMGFMRNFAIDEDFSVQQPPAIGSAIVVANLPGVYKARATLERSMLFGLTLEQAMGTILRPVIGQFLASNDFTQSYFKIIELDNVGNALQTYYDCMLATKRRVINIDQVVIVEDASVMIRYTG